MENSLEFQRRQLWIDIYRDYIKSGIYGFDQCVQLADNALAEFDKRFPQPKTSGMMDEDEFHKWLDKINEANIQYKSCKEINLFSMGAICAYKLLTGKE